MAKKNKTLRQLLSQSGYQNINVKIGCKQGNSFVYCDVGGEMAIATLPTLQPLLRKRLTIKKDNLVNRFNDLDAIYQRRLKKALKSPKIKDKEEYERKLMITKERERNSIPKKMSQYDYSIETPLLDRPVLNIYDGICPDEYPCKIVYIKGVENGDYWLISEYRKKHKKGKAKNGND